ncbi:MAG TPA: N,N-dimethylformamidase beta subunit family domain-containing protein [Solirubrobacteraceae bacterium]
MNPIAGENALQGAKGWWGKHAPAHAIEAYTSQCSVFPGDRLELHVSTRPAARYRIEVYRLGWYGGRGARLLTRHPREGDLRGVARELPASRPGPQIDSARWPVTDTIPVGRDWVSGVYVARLLLASGEHAGLDAFAPFVVRAPLDGPRAAILVQQPVTTAQAYNNWGGKSLYTSNSTDEEAAVKVSFDRPYAAWSELVVNARWPFVWDYHLLRYLEREGFDLAYTTDIDIHREPWSLAGHRLLMTSGHDEYWTSEMRDAFDTQLRAGVNLACMGANSGYWQIRLEDEERTMVEYRWRARDPEPDRARKTELFRNLQPPRPECELWGVQYQDGLGKPGEARHYELTRDCLAHPWMQGTGFEYPATLQGLVGYEWDALQQGCEPPDATVFFHYEHELSNADLIAWRHPSGARVFAAGSLQIAWGLDEWAWPGYGDERLQRFVRNALLDLTRREA